jgi:hypothetical protein
MHKYEFEHVLRDNPSTAVPRYLVYLVLSIVETTSLELKRVFGLPVSPTQEIISHLALAL